MKLPFKLTCLSFLLALLPFLSGCFIKSMAINSVADGLAGQGDTFSSDNDPELIREAVPFSLKFMESILSATPRHVGLLTALAKNFTEYAYAYIHCEGDYTADDNYARSKELKIRAKKLYIRARDYGLRGLDVRHDHFSRDLAQDPKATAAKANKDDVDLLYWTGVSWLAAISLGKDDADLVADVPQAEALLYRAYALNPDYDEGSLEGFLITYENRSTLMGGSVEKAKGHFKRALELSKGMDASVYLNYAEQVDEKENNREEFEEMLHKALAIDPDKKPGLRLENLIMQKRAKWLLSRVDTIFVK
ncbi:MAG TPA: TRAP transporter TatT component family protein [bacterium]|nr:TRAP transporter TatT component family protein [bacterium]